MTSRQSQRLHDQLLMTMIIYYTLHKVAMTCNYSAKNSSLISNTYYNFVRFAIVQSRIPFPQFVLDYPLAC